MTATLRNQQSYLLGVFTVSAARQDDGTFYLVSQPRKSFTWRVENDGNLSLRNSEGYWQKEERFVAKSLREIVGSIQIGY